MALAKTGSTQFGLPWIGHVNPLPIHRENLWDMVGEFGVNFIIICPFTLVSNNEPEMDKYVLELMIEK